MNLICENNIDINQEKQNYALKDTYNESLIPTFNIKELKWFSDQVSNLTKAAEDNDKDYLASYFNDFSKCIQEAVFDSNNPFEHIEFLFPYIDGLLQVDTPKEILGPVLKSVYAIIRKSYYYSLKFVESSAFQRLLSIIEENVSDYTSGIIFNIVYLLCSYEELHDIYINFPIQTLFECLSSNDYQDYSLDGIVNLIGLYLIEEQDDQQLYEFFSIILQNLKKANLTKTSFLGLVSIIAMYFTKNETKSISVLPEKLIEFISNRIYEIVKYADKRIEDSLFFLIFYLTKNGIQIKYNAEDLYQLVLNKEIKDKTPEMLITAMANSIKVSDDIEYSQIFITKSLEDILNYFFEFGSVKSKTSSIILLGAILATDNFELFLSILRNSITFENFLYFIENSEDESTLIFGIGILGNALQFLQTKMPNSDELKKFISIILSSNLSERIIQITESSEELISELLIEFSQLIENEAQRLSQ